MSDLRQRFATFDELVDYCAGMLLKKLIAGEFRAGVFMALDMAIRWREGAGPR